MSNAILLKGGTVATFRSGDSSGPHCFVSDVLIQDTKIVQIQKDIQPKSGVEVINCEGKWIIPGMIDTHRHTFMSLFRGSMADYLLMEYLVKASWSVNMNCTVEDVRVGQLAGCLDALHCGVTTILDHFHVALSPAHVDAALESTIRSGARVLFCPARQSPPTSIMPEFEFDHEEITKKWQVEKLLELGKQNSGKLTADGRVTLGLAYDNVSGAVVQVGDEGDVDPSVKLRLAEENEMHREVIDIARQVPVSIITAHVVKGPNIFNWRDAGLLGPDVVFSHCNELFDRTEVDDEMWAIMKEYDCGIASTPEDELGMAHGNPVGLIAVERGVKCGLGIDCTSINGGDIFTAMRVLLQWERSRENERNAAKGIGALHVKHTSADVFRLGTLGGAEALNMSHLIGSVEVGKLADIVVMDALSSNLAGCIDPVQGIVFNATNADVDTVLVNGEILKRDGKFTKVEWAPVARELTERAKIMRERFPPAELEEKWRKFKGL